DRAVDDVAAAAADHIVHLVLVVRMQADAGALVQHPLAEGEAEAGRVGEERIGGGGAGAAVRAGLFDGDSAFARSPPEAYDWSALLRGARLLHLSGITPALGRDCARAALDAARAAGAQVSFDGNFRARLWAAWDGDPRAILHGLFAQADIAFADHRDIALVLDARFE